MMINQETYNELNKIFLYFKKSLVYVGVFSAIINILSLTQIFYVIQVLDRVIQSRSEATLYMMTLLVSIMFLALGLLLLIRSRMLNRLSNQFDLMISDRIFDAMFDYGLQHPGEGAAQPLNDLNTLREFITSNSLFVFFDAPWLPFYLFLMYLFHPWLAYFGLFVSLLLILLAILNTINSKHYIQQANYKKLESNNFITANIRNIEVITALGMRDHIKNIWKNKHLEFLSVRSKASDATSIYSNIANIVRRYAQILIMGIAAYLIIKSEMTVGIMIAARVGLRKALAPLDLFISKWQNLIDVKMAYQRINYLLHFYQPTGEKLQLPPPLGRLSVNNLVWVPEKTTLAVLKNISFELNKGDILAIIGDSGSGKTSLVKVVMGVLAATHGDVRIDNANILQWDRTLLGQYLGYLPQDVELFDGTIGDNIARFAPVDAQKIVKAAKFTGIHQMILHLPEGYDTIVGSSGHPLSGGQKQLIGLARAFFNDPVLVVLDEPNSSMDNKSEGALIRSVNKLRRRGTTVIIITHRPDILDMVDKILLLQKGELQLFGPKAKVLSFMEQSKISGNVM